MPYFNHPDPSVKRKSGFLTPFYKGSGNLGSSVSIPYFYNLSDSRDLTFKPRIYMDNDFIFHAGTKQKENEIFSNGGRVLNFVSISSSFKESRERALKLINQLNWGNGFFRKDIGFKIIDKWE